MLSTCMPNQRQLQPCTAATQSLSWGTGTPPNTPNTPGPTKSPLAAAAAGTSRGPSCSTHPVACDLPVHADGRAGERQPQAVQGFGIISSAVWVGPLPPTSPGQLRSRLAKLLDAQAVQGVALAADGSRALVTLADVR